MRGFSKRRSVTTKAKQLTTTGDCKGTQRMSKSKRKDEYRDKKREKEEGRRNARRAKRKFQRSLFGR